MRPHICLTKTAISFKNSLFCVCGFFFDVWKKCWHDFSNLQLLIHCHCADKVNCYPEDQKQPVLYKHLLFSCANITGHCVHEFPHVQKHYYSKQTTLSFLTLSNVNNCESFPTFRNIVLVPCVYPENCDSLYAINEEVKTSRTGRQKQLGKDKISSLSPIFGKVWAKAV